MSQQALSLEFSMRAMIELLPVAYYYSVEDNSKYLSPKVFPSVLQREKNQPYRPVMKLLKQMQ